jgi:hypothetical protein
VSHLVTQQPAVVSGTLNRFAPAYWELDFNTGMNATLVTTGPSSFRLRTIFRTSNDLVGLFWRSVDRWDHPLFAYRTNLDYNGCVLDFDIAFPTSLPALSDVTKGLTITVTDIGGNPHFVFVHNYQTSGGDYSGHIRLDFTNVKAGIAATDTIPWDKIESMFFGFVTPNFNDSPPHPLAGGDLHADITFSNIAVSGSNYTLGLGNTSLAAHELCSADGFDDGYPQTPERIVNQLVQLGYRNQVIMYLGFSHYESLSYVGGVLQIDNTKPYINEPAQQWLVDYATHLVAAGITGFCCSVSFEVLASFAPAGWYQKDFAGRQAHSGWSPPSTFLSPCSTAAQTYLKNVAVQFVGLARSVTGCVPTYQVGEPWWWDGSFGGTGPCIYDGDCLADYPAETGLPVPTPFIQSIYSDFSSPAQQAYAVWLQQKLGQATLDLRDAVKTAYPGTPCRVLFYTPQILDPSSPLFGIINFPKTQWSYPAWDKVQVENYGVVTIGNIPLDIQTLFLPKQVLGYPFTAAEYFSGFNLLPSTNYVWTWVDEAVYLALQIPYSDVCIWARPQICRDGFVYDHASWPTYAAIKPAPVYTVMPGIPVGWSVTRQPIFDTAKSAHVSGKTANSIQALFPVWLWTMTCEYLGSRDNLQWLQQLRGFFESMAGQAGQFQFTDPEFNACQGQLLSGAADGYNVAFALVRTVGVNGFSEPISIVTGIQHVYINGVDQPTGWVLSYDYNYPSIKFVTAPPNGSTITADFTYAFLVRFDSDTQDFEEFMTGLHTLKSFNLRLVKP